MNRISLPQFIIFGLLAWGLPAVFVVGPEAIVLTLTCALTVWLINRGAKPAQVSSADVSATVCALMAGFGVLYLAWDMIFGRRMLSDNIFLQGRGAFESSVDHLNATMSEGRGFAELLGSVTVFFPFFLLDLGNKISPAWRWVIWCIVVIFVFNEVGAGRSYLLMAVTAIVAGRSTKPRQLVLTGVLMLATFVIGSYVRGDFNTVIFSNPLVDGVVYPYINLALLLSNGCAEGSWYGYLGAFLNKFLPAFIFSKHVFSFNLEMTTCIYPWMASGVTSNSIFTYLGEFFYYRPPIVTAILAGILIGAPVRIIDRFLVKRNLLTTRLFAGLMSVAELRSRSQDLLSFLLSFGAFLALTLLVLPKLMQQPKCNESTPPDQVVGSRMGPFDRRFNRNEKRG
jgi:hypothetical protein